MHLGDSMRNGVCFLGTYSGDVFQSAGTGFVVAYKGIGYIVTARHVIADLQTGPFAVRLTLSDDSSVALHHDPEMASGGEWFVLDDPTVDLAVSVLDGGELTLGAIMPSLILSDEALRQFTVDVGDVCYTVGLFRLLAGDRKNLPIVHTGNIALLAGQQRIPVKNWIGGMEPVLVDSHLVEQTNLEGLSGAPVFVRPTIVHDVKMVNGTTQRVRVGSAGVHLLGVWQSSWDRPAAVSADRMNGLRVALGVGTVVPAKYLRLLLESERVVADREERLIDAPPGYVSLE